MSLIVTCPRHFEDDAAGEMTHILNGMGDDAPVIQRAGLPGILTAMTDADPVLVCRTIRAMIHDEPWSVRYVLRVIPIREWLCTILDDIVDGAARLAREIGEGKSYRITIEKRNSGISSREIIAGIADRVERTVSLDAPDHIILVEILGARTGISVISSGDILSVEREKRAISE